MEHHHGDHMGHMDHSGHDDHGGHGENGEHGEHGGEHDGGHDGHGGNPSCPMIMTFHWRLCETILWESWTALEKSEFFGSMFGIFLMAFAYEGLKVFREMLYSRAMRTERDEAIKVAAIIASANANGNGRSESNYNNVGVAQNQCCPPAPIKRSISERILDKYHIIQTVLHFVQVIISYLLMLIVMTFNGYLCLGVALGAAVGYFAFGWVKQKAIEVADHCN